MIYLLLILTGYLSGSIPFGYLISWGIYHKDIRKLGSGNIGMANVWRNFGWGAGLSTLLLDFMKGLAPVLVARAVLNGSINQLNETSFQFSEYFSSAEFWFSLVAISCILGHSFTPWLGFRGGKGFASALGAITALIGIWLVIPLITFAFFFVLFRYISLGSITASLSFLIITILVNDLDPYLPLGILTFGFILFTHRSNIARLLTGKEPKFTFKSSA